MSDKAVGKSKKPRKYGSLPGLWRSSKSNRESARSPRGREIDSDSEGGESDCLPAIAPELVRATCHSTARGKGGRYTLCIERPSESPHSVPVPRRRRTSSEHAPPPGEGEALKSPKRGRIRNPLSSVAPAFRTSSDSIRSRSATNPESHRRITPRHKGERGDALVDGADGIQVLVGGTRNGEPLRVNSSTHETGTSDTPPRPTKDRPDRGLPKWLLGKSSKGKKGPRTVFGASIADLVANPQAGEIPVLIRQCVDYLMTHDAHLLEGIFRKSGSHETISQLKGLYQTPESKPDLEAVHDPHCVASLLKQFLGEMAEPVIPFGEYERLIQNFNHFKEPNEKSGVLKNLVSTLPAANRAVLLYLMRFLVRVSRNSEQNLMSSANLGLVFGPTMLRPLEHSPETLMDRSSTLIVAHMLDHYSSIF